MRAAPAVAAALLAVAGLAQARGYRLALQEQPMAPAGAEADLVTAHCGGCHSLDYITTQPPGKGRQFWQDEVAKMINVYGAEVPAENAAAIVAYLGRSR